MHEVNDRDKVIIAMLIEKLSRVGSLTAADLSTSPHCGASRCRLRTHCHQGRDPKCGGQIPASENQVAVQHLL
eukprot:CAMPEP_0171122070 /NCGR_PEP_ID=MMETSP0766_2-20121228/104193_1 /TAXON_ID=439317 /ORGANISM="Gambierdiscus australes, Strain CAWD 149" /LENGTH=72 /DNA_ID=CAMNT_0011584887 /DNA_START=50 /DNA_END=264 /DNA_ORIENTATION=-